MRALYVPASGQPAILGELPVPTPKEEEVLVRVRAAGLNPFDNHIAAGMLEQLMVHQYPLVLGRDASGVVEALGAGVDDFEVGDEVITHVPFTSPFEAGTIAEYVVVPAFAVALKPVGLDFVSAAALPLAAGAARELIDVIDAKPGQVVLVNGGSGGVGRFAVQLLADRGVTVVSTASPSTAGRVRELGALHVVDYTVGAVGSQVRALYPEGVDAMINLTGYVLEDVPLDAVRRGGSVGAVTQVPDDATRAAWGFSGGGVMASPTGDTISVLAQLADAGSLRVDVVRVLRLDEAAEGLSAIESGRAHGKLVVDLSL